MKPLILPPALPAAESSKELTDKQRALVDIIVTSELEGGISLTEAAVQAGYGNTRESSRVIATHTLELPQVQQYLRSRLESQLQISAVTAFKVLNDLIQNGRSEHVRQQAANSVLDRAGVTKQNAKPSMQFGELVVNIDLSG